MAESGPLCFRSVLFVPGGKAKMINGAVTMGADAVVVDLEDAVSTAEKDGARRVAAETTAGLPGDQRSRVFLRVNPTSSPWFDEDVAVVAESRLAGVVLPKFESLEQLELLRRRLAANGSPDALVMVGIETARGVNDCYELLAGGVDGLYFGAEDYVADLGGRRSPSGAEALYARSQVRLAARLRGVPSIDQAVVAVHDEAKFRLDAGEGRDMGYCGKICLHPLQVRLANEVFSPSEEEIAHARRVLEAAAGGAGSLDGEMVDEVHVRMAAAVLARAESGGGAPETYGGRS